jgi:hypothetical protein
LGEFVGTDEVQEVELEDVENEIGCIRGKGPFAFKDIVDMGLGDAGDAGQVALAQLAAPNPLAEVFEEPPLQFSKIHRVLTLFLTAIGWRRTITIR